MNKHSIKINLPNGRKVDVYTRNGAHTFIQSPGPFNFFTTNIESANRIRKKSKRNGRKFTAQEKQRLEVIYLTADALAKNSDPDIFDKIPESEIECWIDHIMQQIAEKAKDRRWIQTGILSEHCDTDLLVPCASMFMQSIPCRLAFERGFFQVLTDFVASRKAPLLPCTDIADTIVMIVSNAVVTVACNENISLTVEKAFKKLESSGMLAQYIRCSTIPKLMGTIGILTVYDELIKCPALIKKKFKIGQPCGNIVSNILNGTDYAMENVEVIKKLQIISSFAEIMQPRSTNCEQLRLHKGLQLCRYCNKSGHSIDFQLSLKACARCKNAYYCCKECQLADWKTHKNLCKLVTKSEKKNLDSNQQTLTNFSKWNYLEILKQFVKVCDETQLDKSELLLELDFKPNDDDDNNEGIAPALRDPPEFKVGKTRDYFEGTRPNEPDWFFKTNKDDRNQKIYRKYVRSVMDNVKDQYDRMTKNHILCLVRFPNSIFSARLQMAEPVNGKEVFSDEAMDGVRRAINDFDYRTVY